MADQQQTLALVLGSLGLGIGIGYMLTNNKNENSKKNQNSKSVAAVTNGVGKIGFKIPSLDKPELPIYLDWNATTPIFPEVTKAMLPYTGLHFGNPSSDSPFSKTCGSAVVQARARTAAMIGCKPSEVVFTSCGTEADNTAIHLAIKSFRMVSPNIKPHIVTTNIEHPAIEQCLAELELLEEIEVTRVQVNSKGTVDADAIVDAIKPSTALVTVMHSNNEVGSIFPIDEIGAKCKKLGVLVHTDAAQSCGKVEINVTDLNVDMLTVVGHKFGAPKGIAALFIRDDCLDLPTKRAPPPKYGKNGGLLLGGGQERGRRAGTENVLLITALGAACDVVTNELSQTRTHMLGLRQRLLSNFAASRVDWIVNGPSEEKWRLPNTLSISFKGIESSSLLHNLKEQVSASAGSACHTGGGLSSVLRAIEVDSDFCNGTLRLSVGRHTTTQDIDDAANLILHHIHLL